MCLTQLVPYCFPDVGRMDDLFYEGIFADRGAQIAAYLYVPPQLSFSSIMRTGPMTTKFGVDESSWPGFNKFHKTCKHSFASVAFFVELGVALLERTLRHLCWPRLAARMTSSTRPSALSRC